ncbi:MAG TPA: DUF1572 domain-containing protein [Chitinophagaceae bacterium]
MNLAIQMAKLFRNVHYGGNWTGVNLKESLADITWEQATTKLYSLNSIAALVFHMNYYVRAVINVLQEQPLDASDKFSFDAPPVRSQTDWENLLTKFWSDADNFIVLVEKLPENKLWETFGDEKYGTYYRNIHGVTEHCHYHLGQIVLIKKLLSCADKGN